MTRGQVKTRLEALESFYEKFNENHQAILEFENGDSDHLYFTTKLSDLVEDSYYVRKGEYADFIIELDKKENPQTTPAPLQNQGQGFQLPQLDISSILQSLPKIDVPKFSGIYSEWPNFRDMFRSLIHRRTDMTPAIKFYYLRTHLLDEALDIVKGITVSDENYEKAWTDLVSYYDNVRRLVSSHLSEFFSVKPMKTDSASELKRMSKQIFNPLDSLQALQRSVNSWDDIITFYAAGKFDPNTRRDWEKFLKDSDEPPKVSQLREFIKSQIFTLESMESTGRSGDIQISKTTHDKSNSNSRSTNSQSSHHTQDTGKNNSNKKSVKCFVCSGDHRVSFCEKFKGFSTTERKSIASSNGRCFNCLGAHFIKNCKSDKTCFHCKQRHHSLLHEDRDDLTHRQGLSSSSQSQNNTQQLIQDMKPKTAHLAAVPQLSTNGVLLATAKIYIQAPNGIRLLARALVDNCSQPSFISSSLCQRLQLQQAKVHAPIKAVGEQTAITSTRKVQFSIHPWFDSSFSCDVQALVLPCVSSYAPPRIVDLSAMDHLVGLELADPHFMDDSHIDLLLGAAVHARIIQGEIKRGEPNMPIASESRLGWLLSGEVPESQSSLQTATASYHCASEVQLDEILQNFWKREEVPKVSPYTQDEQKCENHFLTTHRRNEDGRYVVRLPIKNSVDIKTLNLGDSYVPALKMLQRMENKFANDRDLKTAYDSFLAEYEQLGHMVLTHLPIRDEDIKNCFFLPHHGVRKESSTTTKLRTVFNGSIRMKTGESLNDLLHSGPNLLPNLLDLVCNWRNYKYVFAADIEKMYRQILVDHRDLHLQSILWRFNEEETVQIYRLTTVTYGLTSSSFLALRVIKQLSLDHQHTHPLGSHVISSEIYMDDVLSGAHTIEEAIRKGKETLDILKQGGFPLRKWQANDSQLLDWLPTQLLASEPKALLEEESVTSILGLYWQPIEDVFKVQVDSDPLSLPVNKRSILSKIARIFDPLGWLTPVVVTAKIIMQSLWLLKVDWDSTLPDDILKKWSSWNSGLESLRTLKIPRWSQYTPDARIELHGFADASKQAYGALVYLRIITSDGEIFVSLQLAKSRVAPIKTLTIPKLELCAAHMLAKLVHHYLQIVQVKIHSVHLWSDARDVLHWLKDHPSRWPVFIAHRCADIHELVPNASWHHVNSKSNPADLASRGVEAEQLQGLSLWWNGPQWLRGPEADWPVDELKTKAHTYKHSLSVNAAIFVPKDPQSTIWSLIEVGYSYNKLLRITGLCIRFIYKLVQRLRSRNLARAQLCEKALMFFSRNTEFQDNIDKQEKALDTVTKLVSTHLNFKVKILDSGFMKYTELPHSVMVGVQEIDNARLLWVYLFQRHYYRQEIRALSNGKVLNYTNNIRDLVPFLQDGLLRVGGRLSHSQLDNDTKHPLILPGGCSFSTLLIEKVHHQTLHGGIQLTLSTLRRQYWITRGRAEVKAIVNKCITCRRHAARVPQQLMGELPASRVTPAHPFEHSGVDFAGPFSIRLSKHRGKGTFKGYVSVFVCLCTRAIHLELVEDYTAEAFIACFDRFVSRRGHCTELRSDQGLNFIGADSQLQQMYQEASQHMKQVTFSLAQEGTTWRFNPPRAPEQGGIWEAAVKSAKHHLKRVIGVQVLTFVEFNTILCRVEACLNSRPLMPLHDSPGELDCLTPAHFLIQRSSYSIPRQDISDTKVPYGKRWELVTQAVQHIWTAWKNDYLISLQRRKKWLKITREFKVGDIVIIHRELTPPGKWPLARIIAVHPGPDGHVRVVTVKSANATFQRPITKLVLLLEEEDQKDFVPLAKDNSFGVDARRQLNSSTDEGRRNVRDLAPSFKPKANRFCVAPMKRRSARISGRAER